MPQLQAWLWVCPDHLEKIDLSTRLDNFSIPNAYNQLNLTYLEIHAFAPFEVDLLCLRYLAFSGIQHQILCTLHLQIAPSTPLKYFHQFEHTHQHCQQMIRMPTYE